MSDPSVREIDQGTGYGMEPRAYNANLVEVGPGTPMGELMRRYWQPVFTSAELTSDRPRKVRVLGEDLILFRDRSGRPGLVHEHCAHRGTSLYYGRIEEDGIRCCYHGWKFDVQGRCLDQPCEVAQGEQSRQRIRQWIRQPWYPVQERYGLVYAYMGPPEKKPVLPRWKLLEDLEPGETLQVRWRPTGPLVTEHDRYEMNPVPYNWLQMFENTMDAPHVPWLHYHHSGDQFTGIKLLEEPAELPPYAAVEGLAGKMIVERTQRGVRQGAPLPGPDGRMYISFNEAMVPNVVTISDFVDMMYVVPVDDTHHVVFTLFKSKPGQDRANTEELHLGKTWWEMTAEEHQLMPGDYEAQSSIGELPAHNQEHLSRGDVAVVMLRRRLEEAVRDVAEGRDPPDVSFDEDAPPREAAGHKLMPVEMALAPRGRFGG